MSRYNRTLVPVTVFFVIACLLGALLPISGANWQEVLTVSGNIESILLPTQSLAGTTLTATMTAGSFTETRDGNLIHGVRGEICVLNGGEESTRGLTILNDIQTKNVQGEYQDVANIPVDIGTTPVLEPGQAHCYPIEFSFSPTGDGDIEIRDTVSVTILNHKGWLPGTDMCTGTEACPFGPNLIAEFLFQGATVYNHAEPAGPQPISTPTPQISSSVETPTPLPTSQSQGGITLSTSMAGSGFVENREGISIFGVRGEVCVENTGNQPTVGLTILDTIQFKSTSGGYQDITSMQVDISVKPVIEAGQAYCYPYEFTFTPIDGADVGYRNMVSVTILNYLEWLPGGIHCSGGDACAFGHNLTAEFTFPETTISNPVELTPTQPALTNQPATEPSPTGEPTAEPSATQPQPTEELPSTKIP
jgi:hypothetical protein